jgi:hypothetical protein
MRIYRGTVCGNDHKSRAYHTVAGLVMPLLGRVPTPGERVDIGPLSLEVVDMKRLPCGQSAGDAAVIDRDAPVRL